MLINQPPLLPHFNEARPDSLLRLLEHTHRLLERHVDEGEARRQCA